MTESDRPWAEPVLEIDEHTERGDAIGVDQEIRVLARANRLAIRCDPAIRHDGPEPGMQMLDSRCAVSPMLIRSAGSAGSASP
jgi:hypothetical protein